MTLSYFPQSCFGFLSLVVPFSLVSLLHVFQSTSFSFFPFDLTLHTVSFPSPLFLLLSSLIHRVLIQGRGRFSSTSFATYLLLPLSSSASPLIFLYILFFSFTASFLLCRCFRLRQAVGEGQSVFSSSVFSPSLLPSLLSSVSSLTFPYVIFLSSLHLSCFFPSFYCFKRQLKDLTFFFLLLSYFFFPLVLNGITFFFSLHPSLHSVTGLVYFLFFSLLILSFSSSQ